LSRVTGQPPDAEFPAEAADAAAKALFQLQAAYRFFAWDEVQAMIRARAAIMAAAADTGTALDLQGNHQDRLP